MELELEKKVNDARSRLESLKKKLWFGNCDDDERSYIYGAMDELYSLIAIADRKLRYLRRVVEIEDDEMELAYSYSDKAGYKCYDIYLKGNSQVIGSIEYRECATSFLGNIGYNIARKYNGHNYAAKAVGLLFKILSAEGIESVVITARKGNMASIKTIEKVGGVLIDSVDDSYVVAYSCNTGLKVKNK